MAKELLPDELWQEIEPLLPPHPPRTSKGGRPPVDDRKVLAGIVFVNRTGIPWQMLPSEVFGVSGSFCWRRFDEWQRAGVWPQLVLRLQGRLAAQGKLDWQRALLDSTIVDAKKGAPRSAKAP